MDDDEFCPKFFYFFFEYNGFINATGACVMSDYALRVVGMLFKKNVTAGTSFATEGIYQSCFKSCECVPQQPPRVPPRWV